MKYKKCILKETILYRFDNIEFDFTLQIFWDEDKEKYFPKWSHRIDGYVDCAWQDSIEGIISNCEIKLNSSEKFVYEINN